jgi:CBS domain-containing protein
MAQIKEIMTRNPEVVSPEVTLKEAAKKMHDHDTGYLPVCLKDRIVGVITDRDIVVNAIAKDHDPMTTRVSEAMTPSVFYCFEDDGVEKAVDLMKEKKVRRVMILNQSKRLVGVISLGDLAMNLGKAAEVLKTVSPAKSQVA